MPVWTDVSRSSSLPIVFLIELTKFEHRSSDVFTKGGFSDWNDPRRKLEKHSSSVSHKESLLALDRYFVRPVDEILNKSVLTTKEDNAYILRCIIQVIKHLARQNLPLRGATVVKDLPGDHCEPDSNLWQVLQLLRTKDSRLDKLLSGKQNFTSPAIQNELLQLMANSILRRIVDNIKGARCYSIMIDETRDISNQEQVVICIRYVVDLECFEDCLGVYVTASTTARMLYNIVKDVLLRLGLDFSKCRGQCYDGASAMSGKRSGLKTLLQQDNAKAVYVHCYAHSLNLAINDCFKIEDRLESILSLCNEICKLIKSSPKRDALLKVFKAEVMDTSPGIRTLCPTRWTVRAACIDSILNNYNHLQRLCEDILADKPDSDLRMRVTGIQYQLQSFDSFFGMNLALMVLSQTDNLSKALQATRYSAAHATTLADHVLLVLNGKRSDSAFDEFYDMVVKRKESLDVGEPTLPRRRKAPARLEIGSGRSQSYPETAKDNFRQFYFSALDAGINCIEQRFDQDLQHYGVLCETLLAACKGEDVDALLQQMANRSAYSDEFNFHELKTQLDLLKTLLLHKSIEIKSIDDMVSWFRKTEAKPLLSEIANLLNLILTLPATNAVSERSFSALRRVKTYLRSTMNQSRLNHVMLLNVHKEITDSIEEVSILNEYISTRPNRETRFALCPQ